MKFTFFYLMLFLSVNIYSQNPHRYEKWIDEEHLSQNTCGAFFNADESISLFSRNFTTVLPTLLSDGKLVNYTISLDGKATVKSFMTDSLFEYIPSNRAIKKQDNSDLIIAGELFYNASTFDAIIAKYDKDLNLIWKFIFKPGKYQRLTDFNIDNKGNIYTVGTVKGTETIIYKLDTTGKEIWHKIYNFSMFNDYPEQVLIMDDNHIVLNIQKLGFYDITSSYQLTCLDSLGNIQWQHNLQSPTKQSWYNQIFQFDENQICSVNIDSSKICYFLIQKDSGITNLKFQLNPEKTPIYLLGYPLILKDKSIISIWQDNKTSCNIVKHNILGEKVWSHPFNNRKTLEITGMMLTPDNGVFIYGNDRRPTNSLHPDSTYLDSWYMRTDSLGCVYESCVPSYFTSISNDKHRPHIIKGSELREGNEEGSTLITISPNPISDVLNVSWPANFTIKSLIIYDNVGKIIHQKEIDKLERKVQIDLSNIPTGIYYLRVLNTDGSTYVTPFLKPIP